MATRAELLAEVQAIQEARVAAKERSKIYSMYPDTGPLRRELYPRHLDFFAAGLEHRERLMLAANRTGKTEGIGGFETTLHLTGDYPPWWPGRKFSRPISAWVAGATNETCRDIVQTKLLGTVKWQGAKGVTGTGLIPGDAVGDITWKQGVNDLIDTVKVRHASGGWSTMGIKSYQQGRKSFEGTERDLIWLDEEPDLEVYSECVVRTMTTNGMLILTFTPLLGMSGVVLSFLDGGRIPGG